MFALQAYLFEIARIVILVLRTAVIDVIRPDDEMIHSRIEFQLDVVIGIGNLIFGHDERIIRLAVVIHILVAAIGVDRIAYVALHRRILGPCSMIHYLMKRQVGFELQMQRKTSLFRLYLRELVNIARIRDRSQQQSRYPFFLNSISIPVKNASGFNRNSQDEPVPNLTRSISG